MSLRNSEILAGAFLDKNIGIASHFGHTGGKFSLKSGFCFDGEPRNMIAFARKFPARDR
jgi:hypothetical protein